MAKKKIKSESLHVLEALRTPRKEGFIRLLIDLCRENEEVRYWLFNNFLKDKDTQEYLSELMDEENTPDTLNNSILFGENPARRKAVEDFHVILGVTPKVFGSKTHSEIKLIEAYCRDHSVDPRVATFVRAWQEAGTKAKHTPSLQRAAVELFDTIVSDSQETKSLLNGILYCVDSPHWRKGNYADSPKTKLAHYISENPRGKYRYSEDKKAIRGLTPAQFARFCSEFNICIDSAPGPKVSKKFKK